MTDPAAPDADDARSGRDLFAEKAQDYDRRAAHSGLREGLGVALRARVDLDPAMHLMDFGSGTGLLLQQLAPHVGRITAVDVSPAMHAQLRAKLDAIPCAVELVERDLEREGLDATFDGIVSSMTLHHIRDVPALLATFAALVRPGGLLALADLETEDGRFHPQGTDGVHHHGFDPQALAAQVLAAGFRDVVVERAGVIAREHGDYPVFLLTARR